jgi:hypothetical protein
MVPKTVQLPNLERGRKNIYKFSIREKYFRKKLRVVTSDVIFSIESASNMGIFKTDAEHEQPESNPCNNKPARLKFISLHTYYKSLVCLSKKNIFLQNLHSKV